MHSLRYYGCDKYVMESARDAERNLCEALMPICGGRWGGTARFFRKVRAATVIALLQPAAVAVSV